MKNFTTEERQEIYEHLLVLKCPDVLAALIAERADVSYILDNGYSVTRDEIQSWIGDGFAWWATPEGDDFWNYVHGCVCEFEDSTQGEEEDCSNHGGGSIPDDYLPYDELTSTEPPINIEYIPPVVSYKLGDVVSYGDAHLTCVMASTTPYRPLQPQEYLDFIAEQDKVLVWTRVKLFFGKLFYGV